MSKHVKVSDKGLANFNKAMQELDGLRADVGFWGNAREDNGARVTDVAFWNEYGTDKAPARPFMRRSADTGSEVIYTAALQVARQVIAGRSDARTLLHTAADRFRDYIKETIRAAPTWAAPNALSTQIAKGGIDNPVNMPLIDTHVMIANVRSRVRKK